MLALCALVLHGGKKQDFFFQESCCIFESLLSLQVKLPFQMYVDNNFHFQKLTDVFSLVLFFNINGQCSDSKSGKRTFRTNQLHNFVGEKKFLQIQPLVIGNFVKRKEIGSCNFQTDNDTSKWHIVSTPATLYPSGNASINVFLQRVGIRPIKKIKFNRTL